MVEFLPFIDLRNPQYHLNCLCHPTPTKKKQQQQTKTLLTERKSTVQIQHGQTHMHNEVITLCK